MIYGLLGEHISKSFSPYIHDLLGNFDYRLFEVSQKGAEKMLSERRFDGINVTMPYKRIAFAACDELDGSAVATGAVNTVVNKSGTLYGYNTDVYGLVAMIKHTGFDISGRNVYILGTGGAASAASAAAYSLGAANVAMVSRTEKNGALSYEALYNSAASADVIINATPVGSVYFGGLPVDPARLTHTKAYFDLIYNPLRTRLSMQFARGGAVVCGGLYMLVAQAVKSHALFFGTETKESDIDRVYSRVLSEKRNIALVGMPGSGKTQIGRLLSQRLKRTFLDTDELFMQRYGLTAGEYITEYGEQAFRTLESKLITEISASEGCVISTGGGSVLINENRVSLMSSSFVCYLYRDIEQLSPLKDRPLSDTVPKLRDMLSFRDGIYRECSDAVIYSTDLASAVNEIIEKAML